MNIFTYGSLMFETVWQRVVGADYAKMPARVRGYQRREVKNETYPALIPGTRKDIVDGLVYFNLSAGDVDRLDRFEGEYYRRIVLPCELSDGRRVEAAAYRFKDRYRSLVAPSPWDPDRFAVVGIRQFLSRYKGFADSNPES